MGSVARIGDYTDVPSLVRPFRPVSAVHGLLEIDDQVVRRAVRKAPSGGVLSEEQTHVIRVQIMVIAPREIVNPSEPFWE